ncbi:MAG: aminotransferase class I/II-fold pyridoxal phosphate-dependent enzyme, partial [Clostridia bacterium]|nr:aminotransferase class I/II-fold pyridoxal phosphate-dependent enzyme [Clostridia bacterium]
WCKEEKIKFLCPAPGYDRHFAICESLGIEMITLDMKKDGPDMDALEEWVAKDPAVKGIWCVPKYSNPTGITYSDEVVRRLVTMKTAAQDFRIYWDNAYMIHDLYDEGDRLLNIFDEAKKAGTEDRVMFFTSSSKITFPGAGVSMMAMSLNNLSQVEPIWNVQTIGHDKLNQLRHLEFLTDKGAVLTVMKKHAAILRERFDIVLSALHKDLDGTGIAEWTEPKGGYFISLNTLPGCAARVYELCSKAGVKLTKAGATFPYGKDPLDRNLRLAPSYPSAEDLRKAVDVLTVAVRMASLEKLMKNA